MRGFVKRVILNGMKYLLALLILMNAAVCAARAEDIMPALPAIAPAAGATGPQVCGTIVNKAEYKIYGTIMTDIAGERNGIPARHTQTLVLEPQDKVQVCSSGPFFAGGTLELTLKSLVPLFSCRTRIDRGDIIITNKPRPEGGQDWSATCHPE